MPDHLHTQRVSREQLARVLDGQGWAFPIFIEGGRTIGVRIEVTGRETTHEPAREPEEDDHEQ